MNIPKQIKGEKFIYLLMAYKLAKENGGSAEVGKDSGMVGGQNFFRRFKIVEHNGELLIEAKNGRNFAEYTKAYRVNDNGGSVPTIMEYVNEHGENGSRNWIH